MAAPGAPRLSNRRRNWLIAALFAGIFIGTFDQTFVVTILPQMMSDLDINVSHLGQATWIVNGYLLGYVLALPIMGRAADVYGRVKMYAVAAGIFAVGNALVAVSPNLPAVVGARAFSAVGGGAMVPIGLAIAADIVSERRRPFVLGTLLAGQNASSLAGPLWGAGLEGLVGWRGVFWINVPLILPAAVAVVLLARGLHTSLRGGLDWIGVGLFAAGLLAITFALSDDTSDPRPLALSIGLGLVGVAGIVLFLAWETRTRFPMLEVHIFRRPPVAAANIAYFIIGAALISALVSVPLMQNSLYGGDTIDGAIAVCGLLLALPIGGVLGGFVCERIGYRWTAVGGLVLAAMGFVWMRAWRASIDPIEMWPALFCVGGGLGLCDGPLVATVVENAQKAQRAAATGVVLVLWTVGMITGLALLGSRGLGRFEDRAADLFNQGILLEPDSPEYLAAIHRTYNEVFVVVAIVLFVGAALCLLLRPGEAGVQRRERVPGMW